MTKATNNKHKPVHPAVPTQQDFEQDRFYYNNEEDFREVLNEVILYEGHKTLQEFGYISGVDNEDERIGKFW